MIELTVKTLDSQNHAFSVPDDTTVKQLKERIAESISFPVESQRLIYCGRVLKDEKNLSEYDVNGKVIHLVQRPPPQATRDNGGQQRSSSNQGRRGNHHFRQPRLDGNAMYLGAMAFPADLMDAQGIQAPPSSHSLSDSRLLLARRMLRRATVVLNRLENPSTTETSEPDTPPDEQQDAGSNVSSGIAVATNSDAAAAVPATSSVAAGVANGASNSGGDLESNLNSQNLGEGLQRNFAQAAQAATTAAAIAAAVSAAHASGVPNITIVRSGQAGPDVVDVRMEDDDGAGIEPGTSQSASQEISAQSCAPESQSHEAGGENAEGVESASAALSTNGQSNVSNDEPPRTTVLAVLLDELNRVNQRLQPFMQQYHSLMREYPNPDNNTTAQESQRVFSSVSEIMHFLSHAYHALSDIMCDFAQPPPRALRCRPVLIQHSAVLQAGIPIQAQINVMTNRNNPNNNNNISTNNNGASAQVGTAVGTPQATAPAAAHEPTEPDQQPASNSPPQDNEVSAPSNQEEARNREARDNQEPAFNITPGNVEFFMEVGPGSITIDSLEATVVTNSGSMGGDGIQANVVGGSFPWGAPPPPEFIQNLMQAVAGHMIGRGGTAPSNATTNPGGSGASTSTATSGQNSQARGNTATHPTTATQTRSTSRPHVHLAPATMQGLGSSSFDPFLPCNSHHIRSRARQNAQTFTQQFAAAMSAAGVETSGATGDQEVTTSAMSASSTESQPNQNTPDGQSSSSQNVQGSGTATSQGQASNSSQQQSSQNSQQQATPNAQSDSSQSTAQGPQQQAISSLLNTLSNIFGHMPTGGATTVNFSNIFEPMMAQAQAQAQQRSGSQADSSQPAGGHSVGTQSSQNASNQSSAAAGSAPQFPPGMAFFNFGSPPCFNVPPQSQPNNTSNTPRTTRTQQQSQQQSQQQAPQPEPSSFFQRAGNQSRESQDAFYNPMLTQLFQGLQNITGTELFNMGNIEGNLTDFLMSEGREYHPGTSLILDFLVTLGRNMSLVDIMNVTFGNFEFLNRIRPQMRQFLLESAFENQPVTVGSTAVVVERFVQEIRPHLEIMQQARLREDVDLVTSTIRYNQIRLPELISLIVEGNEVNFGQNMVRWFTRYLREISAIVLHCCLDGEQGLNIILRGYVVELTRGIHPALQVWTIDSCVAHMQNYMHRQNVPFDEIREYLVYRVQPHQSDSTSHQRSFNSSAPSNMKTDHSSTPTPEPMDTDPSPDESSAVVLCEAGMQEESSAFERDSATPTGDDVVGTISPDMPSPAHMQSATVEAVTVPAATLGATPHLEVNVPTREVVPPKREPESPLPSLTMDGEPLPDVVLGSEAWHNVLPSEWVPIIARDSQRQRRQNPQAPFSDAYLSGMPSKRRKVVTSTKPQGNLNQIITESMRSALDEAGVRPVAGVETAGEDLELQAAYREQVRSAVQDSLSNNPDFTPERFPNATKYFSK